MRQPNTHSIELELFAFDRLSEPATRRQLIVLLLSDQSGLHLVRWGPYSPYRNLLDEHGVDRLAHWKDGAFDPLLIGSRGTPKVLIMANSDYRVLTSLSVWQNFGKPAQLSSLYWLLAEISSNFGLHYGSLHLEAAGAPSRSHSPASKSSFAMPSEKLENLSRKPDELFCDCLPDLYWTTLLSPDYVDMIGRKHVEQTPAHSVEMLSNGAAVIQLSEDPRITSTDLSGYLDRRERAKDWLGRDLFYDTRLGDDHPYRVPPSVKIIQQRLVEIRERQRQNRIKNGLEEA